MFMQKFSSFSAYCMYLYQNLRIVIPNYDQVMRHAYRYEYGRGRLKNGKILYGGIIMIQIY